MACAQPRICPGKWDARSSLGFWDTNRSLHLCQMTRPDDSQQKIENLLNSGLSSSSWPQDKTDSKQKERWIHRPC